LKPGSEAARSAAKTCPRAKRRDRPGKARRRRGEVAATADEALSREAARNGPDAAPRRVARTPRRARPPRGVGATRPARSGDRISKHRGKPKTVFFVPAAVVHVVRDDPVERVPRPGDALADFRREVGSAYYTSSRVVDADRHVRTVQERVKAKPACVASSDGRGDAATRGGGKAERDCGDAAMSRRRRDLPSASRRPKGGSAFHFGPAGDPLPPA